jgi:lipooligosaccharide transport system permease protein
MDVFRKTWLSEIPPFLAEPVIILLAMGFGLGAFIGMVSGQDYIVFIVPGVISSYAMFASSFECTYGSFIRMEYQKTYDAILTTPLSVTDVIAGEILWGATRSAMTAAVVLLVAAVFGLVDTPWSLLVPPFAFLYGMMFSATALTLTAFAPTVYTFNYYFSLFVTPMFYFSGVFFPLTSFPKPIQDLSWIAPLTPVVRITRALVNGQFEAVLWLALAIIVGLTLLFSTIAIVAMRRRLTV